MYLKLHQREQFRKHKVADKITRVSETLAKNNSETNEEKILQKIYISPKQRQKIIDALRLIW